MLLEYALVESPFEQDYLGEQQIDTLNSTTYGHKIYATTAQPAAFGSVEAGVFSFRLLEDGVSNRLLEDGTNKRILEDSSSVIASLVHLLNENEPIVLAGAALGKSDEGASELTDLSIVFKPNFFRPGQVLTYEVAGAVTENAANTSLEFTITFPDDGTAATVAMPATVGEDALSDWKLTVTSTFGFDANGNGVVSHTGSLVVANTDEASGQTTTLLTTVSNTFMYDEILYYKPQVAWSAQNANSTAELHSAFMTLT